MICPVCKKPTGQFLELDATLKTKKRDCYLYAFSYPGEKDYLPPRCLACYEKVEARRRK
jgi:hypothetical protein